MTIQINHAILAAHDKDAAATFLAQVFGLPAPTFWGPFTTVLLGDGVHLHFAEPDVPEIQFQHMAFKVSEAQFDAIYNRIVELGLPHWADPQMTYPDQFNTNHSGRGVYFREASGHFLEVLTQSEI